ncbi:hypothetical protein F8S09_05495 [Deinococcus sp. SDU3-2]|uniref:Uncharacterized protein n=1 Tax=Deinococcus terrestris TaxID=2651870 RepID=A0A7X1NUQ6_9DEIO|nr:hypothetical protein [Deinococcus terrestris]MPY66152.1 hypothetical protein [Deinococcus terrestris]
MLSTARLTPEAFASARAFLLERGRPLEAARFRHAFEGGSAADVLDALSVYRNPDGGFGRALEPDVRAPGSSVLATGTALEVLHDLDVPDSDELLDGAATWLRENLHVTLGGSVWPFLPPEVQAQPHAPWWSQVEPEAFAAAFGQFRVNPRAGIVARLHRWPELLPEGLLAQLTLETRDAILAGLEPGDVNGHAVAALFAQTPEVPEHHRQPVLEYLGDVLPERVASTPEALAGYGLDPLHAAPTPASPLAHALEEPLAAALGHLLTSQRGDGSWGPTWDWGGTFPDVWPEAEAEWRSVRTWEALRALRDWGRVKQR